MIFFGKLKPATAWKPPQHEKREQKPEWSFLEQNNQIDLKMKDQK